MEREVGILIDYCEVKNGNTGYARKTHTIIEGNMWSEYKWNELKELASKKSFTKEEEESLVGSVEDKLYTTFGSGYCKNKDFRIIDVNVIGY